MFDLSGLAGKVVQLRFRFSSDSSVTFDGWYVDDVRIVAKAIQVSAQDPDWTPPLKRTEAGAVPITTGASVMAGNVQELPAAAQVKVEETGRLVLTDPATGSYDMRHPAGTWTVVAEAYGYHTLDQVAPRLQIDSPLDGLRTNREALTVSGTVTDESGSVSLIMNGAATPVAADGSFQYRWALTEGTNLLQATAIDLAGNAADAERTANAKWAQPVLANFVPASDVLLVPGATLVIGFDSEQGGRATCTVGTEATLAMFEVTPGRYEVSFTAVPGDPLDHAEIRLRLEDAYGNVAETVAPGTLTVSAGLRAPVITAPGSGAYVKEARITVSGSAESGVVVSIVLNGMEAGVGNVIANEFSVPVTLLDGRNLITAVARSQEGQNPPAADVEVSLDQIPPALAIASPVDGAVTARESVEVSGSVRDESGAVRLEVNGTDLSVRPDGGFSSRQSLREGENVLAVVAQDQAGNITSLCRKVYAVWDAVPLHNLTPCSDVTLSPGQTLAVAFDAESGGEAAFTLLIAHPGGFSHVNGPLTESTPGRYAGAYAPPAGSEHQGALLVFQFRDARGKVRQEPACGRVSVRADAP